MSRSDENTAFTTQAIHLHHLIITRPVQPIPHACLQEPTLGTASRQRTHTHTHTHTHLRCMTCIMTRCASQHQGDTWTPSDGYDHTHCQFYFCRRISNANLRILTRCHHAKHSLAIPITFTSYSKPLRLQQTLHRDHRFSQPKTSRLRGSSSGLVPMRSVDYTSLPYASRPLSVLLPHQHSSRRETV